MNKSGKRTLLMSVIMSSPGPIVVGLGLLAGQSTTQITDFIRRSVELIAIILAFVIYCITTKEGKTNEEKKEKLEKSANLFIGLAMVISGVIMGTIAILFPTDDKGNVIPGLIIAILGVVANSIFWIKYSKLAKETNNLILSTQSKLYRTKSLVDISVTITLLVVLILPGSKLYFYFDIIGTICVSIYLIFSGIQTFYKKQ